jgi:hypothetical protein
MKKLFLGVCLLFVSINIAQTKSDLVGEIEAYKKSKLQNQIYDVSFKELFDAITIMGNEHYGNPTRESESRGYVEYLLENGNIKESLGVEIKGDKQPYKISFNYKKEKKQILYKSEGTMGKPDYKIVSVDNGWRMEKIDLSILNTNFHLRIYKILFGDFALPDDLKVKIESFNSKQKKDKKKVIQGVDFEL